MRGTVVAQVAALRLRTNNTAAVVRPRLENRPSPFLSLSFAGGDTGGLRSRLTTGDCHCSLPRESLELRVVLTPPLPPRPYGPRRRRTRDSPPEIVESPKMATRE